MKKLLLLLVPALFAASCDKCDDHEPVVCTDDFRMVTVALADGAGNNVVLDSFYTIRQSTNQRVAASQVTATGYYVVLDDSYHPQIKNTQDNFKFIGYKNNQVVVDRLYRIGGDKCHIYKVSGADSVLVN